MSGESAGGLIEYAFKVYASVRGKLHLYDDPTRNPRDTCIAIELGQITSGDHFTPWANTVKFVEPDLFPRIFDRFQWQKAGEFGDPLHDLPTVSDGGTELKYVMGVQNEQACVQTVRQTDSGGKEVAWVSLANFYIMKYIAVYTFDKQELFPYHKVLVRMLLNVDGHSTYYHEVDATRAADSVALAGYKYIDVEVVIDYSKIKSESEISSMFQQHFPMLLTIMNFHHLHCILNALEQPQPTLSITHFGRQQTRKDLWVGGNVCLRGGKLVTHSEAGVTILPQYFLGSTEVPVPVAAYPRFIQIPMPHLRYQIFVRMWTGLMPHFFLDNLMQARAVLATVIFGMQSDKIWGGETGFGHGMPFAWVWSTEPNTGKTEACLMGQGLLGLSHVPLMAGESTKPALYEKLSTQSCMTLIVDDVVLGTGGVGQTSSKKFSEIGRTIYDRVSRTVCNKVRLPHSSAMFTSNNTVNDTDTALKSRMLSIEFQANNYEQGHEEIEDLYSQWFACQKLISACAVDFESFLWNGKMDKEAIGDCALYLQGVVGSKRDRNVNCWGMLMYYMLNLNYLAQEPAEENAQIFKWVVEKVTRSNHEANKHSSLVDQFVLAISKLRGDAGHVNPLGPIEKTIFWHNMRSDQTPSDAQGLSNLGCLLQQKQYYAFRIEPCLAVLKAVLGKDIIRDRLSEHFQKSGHVVYGYAMFADPMKMWPLQLLLEDEGGIGTRPRALQQDEVPWGVQSKQRAWFIEKKYFDDIVKSAEEGAVIDVDYTKHVIKSNNPDAGDYNLYECATGAAEDGWFGYRACGMSNYKTFCGALNALNIGTHTTDCEWALEVETKMQQCGYGSCATAMHPVRMLEFFNYKSPVVDALPPCYKEIPWTSRDDEGDYDHDDPLMDVLSRPPSPDPQWQTPVRNGGSPMSSPESLVCDSYNPTSPASEHNDDKQNNWLTGLPRTRRVPGSSPLADISKGGKANSSGPNRDAPQVKVRLGRATQRGLGSQFVSAEAEASEGSETEEEVRHRHSIVTFPYT